MYLDDIFCVFEGSLGKVRLHTWTDNYTYLLAGAAFDPV